MTWMWMAALAVACGVVIWQWRHLQGVRQHDREQGRQLEEAQAGLSQELAAKELVWTGKQDAWQRELQYARESAATELNHQRQQQDEALRQQETLWTERQQQWDKHQAQLLEQHARDLSALKHAHEDQVKALQEAQAIRLDQLRQQQDDTQRQQETLWTERQQQWEKHRAQLLEEHGRAIASLTREYDARIMALRDAQDVMQKQFKDSREEQEKNFNEKNALLKDEFKALSEQILKERSSALVEVNREQLSSLLNPFSEKLGAFNQAVMDAREKGVEMNASLSSRLEQMFKVTQSVGHEATELTKALRGGNKTQGNWGEFILEELLERSGLQANVHFNTQATIQDADGKTMRNEDSGSAMRPDVIVKYPDNKFVVIDSKVSLTAYVEYMNAEPGSTLADEALSRHMRSVQAHVDELAKKDYPRYQAAKGETVDYVIMFIPNEASYQLAMHREPVLWQRAFEKRVLVVSPVNLLAMLYMIHIAWTRDDQVRNQREIMTVAQTLLDRAMEFYQALDKVGDSIEATDKAYQEAVKRLKGEGRTHSVLNAGKKLQELSIKSRKGLQVPKRFAVVDDAEDDGPVIEAEAPVIAAGSDDGAEEPAP